MAQSDLVSVTIVTYDSGRFIKRCLESVLSQRYPLKEVIVVDNASTDGTIDILEQFEDRCHVYYNEENIGFAAAQVCYLGDDDIDVPALRWAGIGGTVPSATPAALAAAGYVASRPPGRGAVREVCERMLDALR